MMRNQPWVSELAVMICCCTCSAHASPAGCSYTCASGPSKHARWRACSPCLLNEPRLHWMLEDPTLDLAAKTCLAQLRHLLCIPVLPASIIQSPMHQTSRAFLFHVWTASCTRLTSALMAVAAHETESWLRAALMRLEQCLPTCVCVTRCGCWAGRQACHRLLHPGV